MIDTRGKSRAKAGQFCRQAVASRAAPALQYVRERYGSGKKRPIGRAGPRKAINVYFETLAPLRCGRRPNAVEIRGQEVTLQYLAGLGKSSRGIQKTTEWKRGLVARY